MRDEGGEEKEEKEEKSGSRGRQAQGVAVTDNRAGAEKCCFRELALFFQSIRSPTSFPGRRPWFVAKVRLR